MGGKTDRLLVAVGGLVAEPEFHENTLLQSAQSVAYDKSHKKEKKFVATALKLGYRSADKKMFWGEQPPFTSIGRGGRYFFGDMRL